MAVKKKTFEAAVSRLEEIVTSLERGDVPLEDALKLFEEGTALCRECTALLDQAEQQVKILTSAGEVPETKEFQV